MDQRANASFENHMPTDFLIDSDEQHALSLPPSRIDALDEAHPVLVASGGRIERPLSVRLVSRWASTMAWGLLGILLVVAAWAYASSRVAELPSPAVTMKTLRTMLGNPFYDNGPNDKGVGWQFFYSLQRVFFGFGFGTLIGVPLGLLIGSSKRAFKTANPVIQLLRPVSPLAWFPIWLYLLKDSPQAAKFVIFITALWPVLLNTATSAGSVPPDQKNVSTVFTFNKRTYVRHVLLPNAMPGVVTGMRLSMGVSWMVIVAVEMMSVGSGVGAYVWEANNAGDLSKVMASIILIGLVGLSLDAVFLKLGKRFAPLGGKS
jgi:nitrate/nitrite transport system permease protein